MNVLSIKKSFAVFFFLLLLLAAAPLLLRSETTATDPGSSLPLSDLAMPEEIGKVQERFAGRPKEGAGSNARTIIQIQDVHAHVVAQQNIAAILERLRTVFGVEKAALEGAWSTTSLPKSHAIPTSRKKQLLAGTLLEDDLLSGPVFAAIMSPQPITLVGIEDETLYEKNRAVFLTHSEKTMEIREKLDARGATLQNLQRASWGPDLLEFGNVFWKFRETSDLGQFFPVLLKKAEAHGIAIADLAQILLFRDILAFEKTLEKERLDREIKLLMQAYKNNPWTVEELIRGGRIPPEKLGLYPEIKKLARLYRLRDSVSLQELTAQIETLTDRVLGILAGVPEERALWEKTGRFYLAKKILLLQATPEDLKRYEAEKIPFESEFVGTGLSEGWAVALDFYEAVKKRDDIFFQKIMNDPSLAGDIAVITGGFHTDGLSQKFRDAGIPYLTIMPELGGTSMNEKLYTQRMSDPIQSQALNSKSGFERVKDQTLSELRNRIEIDEKFLRAFEVLNQVNDVRRAKARFSGEPVTVLKNDEIRDLVRGKRLERNHGPGTVSVLPLNVDEFTTLPHGEQLEIVRALIKRAEQPEPRPALISSVRALKKIAESPDSAELIERVLKSGDSIALLKDGELLERFLLAANSGRVKFFETEDGGMDAMIFQTPSFQIFIRHHPPVIVKNGYTHAKYPVLAEKPESLRLYRIITLSESLYQAAKNPEFLALLEGLVSEILSKELSEKSA